MPQLLARKFPKLAALFLILLASSVIIGWHIESAVLTQILPHFSPMQYNTALAFLISGIGFLALNIHKPRLGLVGGLFVALIGTLTLLQYTFSIDLSID